MSEEEHAEENRPASPNCVTINVDYSAPPPSYDSVIAGTTKALSCTTCAQCHEIIPLTELRHSDVCPASATASSRSRPMHSPPQHLTTGSGTTQSYNDHGGGNGTRYQTQIPGRRPEDSWSSFDETYETYLNTRPSSHLCFSIIVCLCCNPVCGCIAVGYSSMANEDKARGDYEAASKHAVKACWFNITGIFISLCVIGSVLAALYLT